MPIFEWKTEYETGTQQIDDQHRYLVALINRLDHLINNSEGAHEDDVSELEEIFSELFDYTVYHFNYEEQLMEQTHYASASMAAHKRQHTQFIQELKSVLNDFQDVKMEDGTVILSFLTNWLINHICKIDKKFAHHLQSHPEVIQSPPTTNEVTETQRSEPEDERLFLGLFMDFSSHLSHHLSQVEKQLGQLLTQTPPPKLNYLTEKIVRRVRIVQSLIGNLESSAKKLRKSKKPPKS